MIYTRINDLMTNIKTNLENRGINNYYFNVGKPEVFEEDINKNSNIFPLIVFTDINYQLNEQYVNDYLGYLNTTLIISDVDNNERIFEYLEENILKNILNTINTEYDIKILNVEFDDNVDCVYSIYVDLQISFNYSI